MTDKSFRRQLCAAVWILVFIFSCLAAYWTKAVLVPLIISLFGYLILRPLVCKLNCKGVPQKLSAMCVLGCFILLIAGLLALVVVPAQRWLQEAPESMAKLQEQLDRVREPLMIVDKAEEKIEPLRADDDTIVEVNVEQPQLMDEDRMMSQTGQVAAYLVFIAVTTLFLLMTGDDLLQRMLHALPTSRDRVKLLTVVTDLQDSIGRYFGNITIINFGLGVAITVAMWLLGMPTPFLWGAIGMFCNFIPYIGPLIASGVTLLAATSHFDSITHGLAIGVCFWLITAIEGQFVTPTVIGNAMKTGPVIVLVSVAFWGYLWGLAGIFLAVPLAITARLICVHFEPLHPFATVLGDDSHDQSGDIVEVEEDQPLTSVA